MAPLTSNRTILSAARYRDNIFVLGGSNGFNAVDIVEQTKITEGVKNFVFSTYLVIFRTDASILTGNFVLQ